ncbi:aspartate semialdehyde dehydrogenase [Geoalkalibacter ferrihydriticus]|uniref:Aspartate-semialdehyde dehydrogenase n=2 Tax=Geoalkalibacter ferrihydriticus TaxID=392333 RepID=A0A0C2HHZ4_9BACT|nr:aspartate-semialdehyde dehydrogenase [Geoalkalibacter ferrihydriticus]KIH76606.1 aspartate-semialdehyde dehydrogenase [Geoalkalibacter ferrihydriticus DSM 17813]SDM03289.1 aspartate semialdehyde dehydrogenase [Geoalkalibacter ferrihydriticus]
MLKTFKVAIVGATGAVGTEILQILGERNFPVAELRLLASERSEGNFLEFQGEQILVERLTADSFAGIDIAIFCAGDVRSKEYCLAASAAGAVCIDDSNAWRTDPEVPLVVSEVNSQDIAGFRAKGIVANPSGSTIALALALKPLHDFAKIRRVVVSTYQSVSASGLRAVEELRVQTGELLNGRPAVNQVYPHQIAFNCLPHIDGFLDNGCTREEMALVQETRKILGMPSLGISATAVRVPVFYGDSETVNIETEAKISAAQARELLSAAPGLRIDDESEQNIYPLAIDAAGQDLVLVGRIREDQSLENGLNLWVVADNLRKGATNVVRIAEILAADYL